MGLRNACIAIEPIDKGVAGQDGPVESDRSDGSWLG